MCYSQIASTPALYHSAWNPGELIHDLADTTGKLIKASILGEMAGASRHLDTGHRLVAEGRTFPAASASSQ